MQLDCSPLAVKNYIRVISDNTVLNDVTASEGAAADLMDCAIQQIVDITYYVCFTESKGPIKEGIDVVINRLYPYAFDQ